MAIAPFQALRRIKSYVSRHRSFSKEQETLFQTLLSRYGLPCVAEASGGQETRQKNFNFNQIFQRIEQEKTSEKETILEIGFGEGRFLLEMARAFPDKDFIGMEVYKRGVAKLLGQIEDYKLSNLRIFWGDAVTALNQAWPLQRFSDIYVLFPDPWPKTRHHKRRIIQVDFLNKLASLLKIGGILHLTTDDVDYRDHMLAVASKNSMLERIMPSASENRGQTAASLLPRTKYEARAQRFGLPAWDLQFRRLALCPIIKRG